MLADEHLADADLASQRLRSLRADLSTTKEVR